MYLASIDFAPLATSASLSVLAPLVALVAFLLPTLLIGFVGQFRRAQVIPAPVGVFRVARDGRAFIQIDRVCHFGRRGESEESLRARVSL